MRAVVLDSPIVAKSQVLIEDDKFHHLKNVLRIKKYDELMLLNNSGSQFMGRVLDMTKKTIVVDVKEERIVNKYHNYKLALGITKKEALELNIKQAIELGISTLYLVETEYSQKVVLKEDRLQKLIESAQEQSNNPFPISIKNLNLDQLLEKHDTVLCFASEAEQSNSKMLEDAVIFIGPEGGFSHEELSQLRDAENVQIAKANTPIMRATTAVPYALGSVLKY
jgi:16S rRNA (uracil1498-N3)-methyltransferase